MSRYRSSAAGSSRTRTPTSKLSWEPRCCRRATTSIRRIFCRPAGRWPIARVPGRPWAATRNGWNTVKIWSSVWPCASNLGRSPSRRRPWPTSGRAPACPRSTANISPTPAATARLTSGRAATRCATPPICSAYRSSCAPSGANDWWAGCCWLLAWGPIRAGRPSGCGPTPGAGGRRPGCAPSPSSPSFAW